MPLLAYSRALMRFLASAVLRLKQIDSSPVSRKWQWCLSRSSSAVVMIISGSMPVEFRRPRLAFRRARGAAAMSSVKTVLVLAARAGNLAGLGSGGGRIWC